MTDTVRDAGSSATNAPSTDADQAGARPQRMFIPAIEGLRGCVALLVVIGHTGQAVGLVGWTEAYPGDPFWGAILHRTAAAFPIFFVLTGYLLYRAFALATLTGGKKPNVKRYLWRRALRILPAYWALTAVAWLVSFIVLLLSATGIHALMSFIVARRTREIGIRAALGAHPGRIIAGIFGRALIQISIGLLAGSALVFKVGVASTREFLVLLAVDGVMLLAGLTACYVPLRRALRIDPTEALRAEA